MTFAIKKFTRLELACLAARMLSSEGVVSMNAHRPNKFFALDIMAEDIDSFRDRAGFTDMEVEYTKDETVFSAWLGVVTTLSMPGASDAEILRRFNVARDITLKTRDAYNDAYSGELEGDRNV